MAVNDNNVLVLGYFANEHDAKDAAKKMKDWDAFNDEVKLGAMAALTVKSGSDKLHADEIGERHWKSGAAWGTAVGAAVGILTAGVGLIPGLIVGAAAGGGLGALNHKSVGMSDEQHAELVSRLRRGGAALAIMADDFEVPATEAKLVEFGGTVEVYEVPDETVEVLATAAAAQAAASEAIDEAVEEVEEVDIVEAARAVEVDVPDLDVDHRPHVSKLAAATGISAATAAKLHDAGVEKPSNLLEMAATPDGRAALAAESGVDEADILYQAKKLDLMRVKGVGYKYATLLLAAGVDTVPELATRNAANLAAKCAEVNAAENIVVDAPSEDTIAGWVAQAKELPRMLYY